MWSLSGTLDRLAPRIGRALVPAPALTRLREVAQRLPAPLTNRIYLESWLRGSTSRVDLIVGIDADGRALLAEPSLCALDPDLRRQPAWGQVAAFARAWDVRGSLLEREVTRLWLEFDLAPDRAPADAAIEPRVFVDFQRQAQGRSAGERLDLALEVLRAFCGGEIEPTTHARLLTCFAQLPTQATVPFIGLSLRPTEPAVRVCASGLGADLAGYLAAVGWRGDGRDLQDRILAPLAAVHGAGGRAASILHFDLLPDIGPRIGVEYAFKREAQPSGRLPDTALLDYLVTRGWCTPSEADALAGWPGSSVELMAHDVWHSRVTRWLNHLKVTYATDQVVELKAYLCVFSELLSGGTLVGTRPRLFAAAPAVSRATARSIRGGARSATPPPSGAPPQVVDSGARVLSERSGTRLATSCARLGGVSMATSDKQQQALEQILARASVDLDFRNGLLEDPRQAILAALGIRIPSSFRLKFIERARDVDALVVLPEFHGELANAELDVVAGGAPSDPGGPDAW